MEKGKVFAGQAAAFGEAAALDSAQAGAALATKTANFAMSDQGKLIIQDGVQNGVQVGTSLATGNTVGAVVGTAKLARDGAAAAQGIMGASEVLGDVLLINLNAQRQYRNTPMYLY